MDNLVHPHTGVWVEINEVIESQGDLLFIPIRGCGLKYLITTFANNAVCSSPYGGVGCNLHSLFSNKYC